MTQPENTKLTPLQVAELHRQADTDSQPGAAHHTLGPSMTQASPGNHKHNGQDSPELFTPTSVIGSRGGNAALANLLIALDAHGIIANNSSA